MYEKITPSNVLMYAIRNYNNPHCEGEKEFEDDLKRFKYVKRLEKIPWYWYFKREIVIKSYPSIK